MINRPLPGGSSQLRPVRVERSKTTWIQKKALSQSRGLAKLGSQQQTNLQIRFQQLRANSMQPGANKKVLSSQMDGIILSLLELHCTHLEIRTTLGCGSEMIKRVIKQRDNPSLLSVRSIPHHAASVDDVARLKENINTDWAFEDGYPPCAHRNLKKYFLQEGLTWTMVYEKYAEKMMTGQFRKLSLSRWRQYVKFYFPGLSLARKVEDVCDCCTRFQILLDNPTASEAERDAYKLQLECHKESAFEQRRVITQLCKKTWAENSPTIPLPDVILPSTYDENEQNDPAESIELEPSIRITLPVPSPSAASVENPIVQIVAEDFGGGLTLPFYGKDRPSCDYFNSNLTLSNFVQADITTGTNYVTLYDERGQGKDADALCNLRLAYHLKKLHQGYQILIVILDNCVGQNKSNTVMKFMMLLTSLGFYKKVVLIYLIPGHSHMIADRVVAWTKNSLRTKNLYSPEQIRNCYNGIKSVECRFLDHRNNPSKSEFLTGWAEFLSKDFKDMPLGFTSNYLFEFERGQVMYRKFVTTPDSEASLFSMSKVPTTPFRNRLAVTLFGDKNTRNWTMENLTLNRAAETLLTEKKIISLSKKYFSIPVIHRPYYPTIPQNLLDIAAKERDGPQQPNLPRFRQTRAAVSVSKENSDTTKKLPPKATKRRALSDVTNAPVSILKHVTLKPQQNINYEMGNSYSFYFINYRNIEAAHLLANISTSRYNSTFGVYFYNTTLPSTLSSGNSNSGLYLQLMAGRNAFFERMVSTLGLNFIFTDLDTVFLRDPFVALNIPHGISNVTFASMDAPEGNTTLGSLFDLVPDIVYSTDARTFFHYMVDPYEGNQRIPRICGGFFFIRSNERTIQLWKHMLEKGLNDQYGMEKLLDDKNSGFDSVMVNPLPAGIEERKDPRPVDEVVNATQVVRVRVLSQAAYRSSLPYYADAGTFDDDYPILLDELKSRGEYEVFYHPNYWMDAITLPYGNSKNKTLTKHIKQSGNKEEAMRISNRWYLNANGRFDI